ncbi:MAG: geranylgeranylglycerol-phosphate geranylgeranyltransferase [Polaribacter sp.]|uniref:geranylgeranylglycerol-phosphate geranylgeranyltransferase n=1 Tax=Polaribacter sp. TaxID=1920175 RepID=UPI003267CC96
MVLLTMILTKYALINSFTTNIYLSHLEFLTLILSVLLITAGGYIINDIFDIETDKINKPDKVFVNVSISRKNAWLSYIILTLLGLILGVALSIYKSQTYLSVIFIITVIGLFIYSKTLKNKILIGNILVSCFVGLTIFLVFSFELYKGFKTSKDNITNVFKLLFPFWSVLGYFLFAFLTTLIREIIKDIEDINGDLKIKAKTLPIAIGRKRASKVAFFFTSILLLFLFIVLQLVRNEYLFLAYGMVFLLLPLLYFMYKLWIAASKKDFSKLSNQMKVIMFFGILSMLLFKFI